MLSVYFLTEPLFWILPWILQAIGYFFILRKMDLKKWTAIIPLLAEWQLSSKLFPKRRTFFRPFITALILCLGAAYLGPYEGQGRLFMLVAFAIYGIFLIRLYWRLAKALGKGRIFAIGLIIIPPVFLMILGLGKSSYTPLQFKPEKERSKASRIIRRIVFVAISILEIVLIVAVTGFLAVKETPPAIMVGAMLEDTYDATKDIKAGNSIISSEDVLGKKAASAAKASTARDYFYPDHEDDESVVVLTYVIGSNLEDKNGLASANIRQMMDATEQGDGLKFVVEAGGSERWFTKGIDDSSYGRYEISEGKINKVQDLPDSTCMSKKKSLSEFLKWANKNYTADRYMLVLWDHGGGVSSGYGLDDINSRNNATGTMDVSEIADALGSSHMKFDVIGFDACLMQDIEIAKALEPYADYYLASEEVEGGYGWYYTSAFGKLAKDPGLSSEEFGKEIVGCYDPYNAAVSSDGKPDKTATLSFVDLTRAAFAYEKLETLFDEASVAMKESSANYANMATAANNAYSFTDDIQIDLIGFLKILKKVDYDDEICTAGEKRALIRALQSSVLYRNGASARGINGLSIALPYKSILMYDSTSEQLDALSLDSEKLAFDEMFSIMAAQQSKGIETVEKDAENMSLADILTDALGDIDYTQSDWYIEGFEDYDDTNVFVDIPLKEVKDGLKVQLSDKAWDIITDCQTAYYQVMDAESIGKGKRTVRRYLGKDQNFVFDDNDIPVLYADGYWVHVNGQLVCYEAEPVISTDEGYVFTGKIKARLNDRKDITLNVEWNIAEKSGEATTGHITGYDDDSLFNFLNTKGSLDLKAGDTIQFLFDYYDDDGNLVKTRAEGDKIRITKQSRLEVKDQSMGKCTLEMYGILTDIYQRTMITEAGEAEIK